jgi:hypothetical protein
MKVCKTCGSEAERSKPTGCYYVCTNPDCIKNKIDGIGVYLMPHDVEDKE